ncbi:MAG: hypothetical protein JWM93_2592 [Frankiales bacterium]|nr:hypothetical protein [Frankiales bacterium]
MQRIYDRLVRSTGAAVLLAVVAMVLLGGSPASAHGFSSVVFADITAPEAGHVRTVLGLEYDLLVVSAADAAKDDALFRDGTAAFEDGDDAAQAAALEAHADTVLSYVTQRYDVSAAGRRCAGTIDGPITIEQREGVPYALLTLDHACTKTDEHEVRSGLFPDSEQFVRGTKTIVTYDLDHASGSAALDADHSSFSTRQSTGERFWEFFKLGAEHLYTGIDHILFLLALIAGSRRLREVVLAATTFTLAHSVTLILAALGLVSVSPSIVEPVIALSIAVVAGWHLWQIARRGSHATDLETASGSHLSLDRAGWARLGVVFCFGLIHGLGFAGALGIDQAFSWTLLWSLLVFNVGIEAVQLGLIVLVFPVLVLLRHRAPRFGLVVTGAIAAVVAVMGLVWFIQRIG